MIKDVEQIRGILKNHNLKSTPQRVVIYQIMSKLGHASADMIYGEISDQFQSLTVATIYNVLDSFVEVGLLKRRLSSNNKMYFDVNTYNHCHLYSQSQERYTDYDDPQLIGMLEQYFGNKKLKNFELSGVEIQLNGHFKK
ncbi:MAG: transcriptional repressor [Bacteroidales bacterium]|nr:transcriptional repressor [Bacteroidales bacterium]MDD4669693.1 transcriptional repressor [Bacteroidales bacterium]